MIRIPIRKWEKVETDPYTGGPVDRSSRRKVEYGFVDETYRLEVMINGTNLVSTVRVPALMALQEPQRFREHIVAQLSRQIAGIVAEEIQRSIV